MINSLRNSAVGYRKRGGLGPELHTDANAAADPANNEANATTGWTPLNNCVLSSVADPYVGSYAIQGENNTTPTAVGRFRKDFTVETGATYVISFAWKHVGVGGTWNFSIETIVQDTILNSETSYDPKEFEFEAIDTSMRCQFSENNVANDGGVIFDNFSIRKKL